MRTPFKVLTCLALPLFVLLAVGRAQDDSDGSAVFRQTVQLENREFLSNLSSLRLKVIVYGHPITIGRIAQSVGRTVPGRPELYERIRTAAELKLRQSGIRFADGEKVFGEIPKLVLVLNINNECHAEIQEDALLQRLKMKISIKTWQHYFTFDVGENDHTIKRVKSDEEAFQALDSAVTAFCNDYLAANPKPD